MQKRRANKHLRRRPGRELPRPARLGRDERELLALYRGLPPVLRERLMAVVRLIAAPDGPPPATRRRKPGS